MSEVKVARGLDWFSVSIGLVEMLATDSLSAFLGSKRPEVIQAFGVREFAAGVGILTQKKPKPGWLWARVGGDALDIAALILTYQNNKSTRPAVGFSLANVLAITALDIWCAQRLDS